MSHHDYETSKRLLEGDPPIGALLMAAMRKADTANGILLRQAFPWIWDELQARYDAPGGLLDSERDVAPQEGKPIIYGFLNGGSPGWYNVCAIAEDGTSLGGHCCSSPTFFKGDLGFTEDDWSGKRKKYDAHYPDGYSLEWVERDAIEGHEGLQAAFKLGTGMQAAKTEASAEA